MPRDPLCTPSDHRLSRRQWLGSATGAALGLGGLATPAVAEALRKEQRQVLFIWLDGGMSQLESWDPKPNTPFGGPYRSIPTSVPGINISELLPESAKVMKHLAIVRSVSTQDNSHSAGVDRIQRGDRSRATAALSTRTRASSGRSTGRWRSATASRRRMSSAPRA
jgi:hypothetical protein